MCTYIFFGVPKLNIAVLGHIMDSLPTDIYQLIASIDTDSWRAMLAVPRFARFTLTEQGRRARDIAFLRIVCKIVPFNNSIRINAEVDYEINNNCDHYSETVIYITNNTNDMIKFVKNRKVSNTEMTIALIIFRFNGQMHRDDGPAVVYANGRQEWWCHGKLHREGGPAVMIPNHHVNWFNNGLHYLDGNQPAIILKNYGLLVWFRNGRVSRDNKRPIQHTREFFWEMDYRKLAYKPGERHLYGLLQG